MCNWPDGFQVTVTNPETRAHFPRSAYFRTMPLTQNDPISAILECVSNCGEFISPGEPMVFTVSVQCLCFCANALLLRWCRELYDVFSVACWAS